MYVFCCYFFEGCSILWRKNIHYKERSCSVCETWDSFLVYSSWKAELNSSHLKSTWYVWKNWFHGYHTQQSIAVPQKELYNLGMLTVADRVSLSFSYFPHMSTMSFIRDFVREISEWILLADFFLNTCDPHTYHWVIWQQCPLEEQWVLSSRHSLSEHKCMVVLAQFL